MRISYLVDLLDRSYNRPAWQGTNLRGSLRGVTVEQAAWRPAPGRHNIWEIVLHAAYWKYAVRRSITGAKRGSFPHRGSNWFVRSDATGPDAWRRDLALLDQEHRLLRDTVAQLPEKRLMDMSAKKKWTLGEMITGSACHDVYHTGQIQLLKRLGSIGEKPRQA